METADIDAAATAVRNGDLVAYPTETVYGLGADALDAAAVERVFEAKGRDRDKPISLAVPSVEAATECVRLTQRERAFMSEFLPGPVTVVCQRRDVVPDVLTAGRDRVGVRIPDHEIARELAASAGPVTATSANVSGEPSARRVADIQPPLRAQLAAVIDGETTPGGGSTVVDVDSGEVFRRGHDADVVEDWLASH